MMSTDFKRFSHPVGFAPSEISALVNGPVVEQHASEASFLWTQRVKAVSASHYKLKHLGRLDARLDAHLRGLRVAGAAGWRVAQVALGDLTPGSLFVGAYLAFASRTAQQMYQMLQLGLTDDSLERTLVGALEWIEYPTVHSALAQLLRSKSTAHRRIGLTAMIGHRRDVDREVEKACGDEDPSLRLLAFKSIGAMKRRELRNLAEPGLRDSDPLCRFWSGWSLAMHGDAAAAVGAYETALELPSLRRPALEMALRFGELPWARELIRSLAGSASTLRNAIDAVGIFGDPDTVPWLLDQMQDMESARVAGEAFSTITGVDLKYMDLTIDPPDDVDAANEEDSDLRWPDAPAVNQWWSQHRSQYYGGQRYIGGELISADSARRVLSEGYQRQRAGAALEMTYRSQSAVFPVGARADRQRRWLQP
jgi:uncharacterized protein (TIGR02270 family)